MKATRSESLTNLIPLHEALERVQRAVKHYNLEMILAVASGQPTKSEQLGIGDEEFLPWLIGPTL